MHSSSPLLCAIALACGLLAGVSAFATAAAPEARKLQVAGLEVAEWLPSADTPAPWPIIVFSHGFHGRNTQSTFLLEAVAQAGYAVFAPNHGDAACRNPRAWKERAQVPFRLPDAWNDMTYAERAGDIEKLLDTLSTDRRYHAPPLDWQHVGLVVLFHIRPTGPVWPSGAVF